MRVEGRGSKQAASDLPPRHPTLDPRLKEVTYVKVTNNLRAHYFAGLDWLYEPGPISRQQTTDSDTGGREPWTIRNELSERNRTGAFARGHTTGHPGTLPAGRRTGPFYDRRRRLRPTASLSSLLSRGRRQLHCARRSHGVRVRSQRMSERSLVSSEQTVTPRCQVSGTEWRDWNYGTVESWNSEIGILEYLMDWFNDQYSNVPSFQFSIVSSQRENLK
jgi:hypothetical protein